MQQEDFDRLAQEVDQAIANAESALAEARERREKAGFGGDDARARIESLPPPEEIAEVEAQVRAELELLERDAQFKRAQSGQSGTTATQVRHKRQMI